jgi:hypothetical protein
VLEIGYHQGRLFTGTQQVGLDALLPDHNAQMVRGMGNVTFAVAFGML